MILHTFLVNLIAADTVVSDSHLNSWNLSTIPNTIVNHPEPTEHPIPDLVLYFNAVTAATALGRISTRFQSMAVGICAQSTTRSLVKVGTDVG